MQGSCEQPPASPQPSVDRLSVTWAEPGSMSSSGVNLFHLPSETPVSNEVKFSPTAGGESSSLLFLLNLFFGSFVLAKRFVGKCKAIFLIYYSNANLNSDFVSLAM